MHKASFSATAGPAPTQANAASNGNMRGAVLMMVSMATFVCNDAIIKFVSQTLPLSQAVLLRGLAVSGGMWLLARRAGRFEAWPASASDRRMLLLRNLAEVGSTILYLLALQQMALGNLSAIMQTLPLLVMLAAAAVFREPLGPRRLAAAGVGLAGVLLILRPGTSAFTGWSLVALASVLLIVVREIATRSFSPRMPSSTIAIWAALSVTLSAPLIPAQGPWRWPSGIELAGLSVAAVCLGIGYLTAVASMRVGEVGFVSPFRYTSLLWATALGAAIFGDWPDLWTWSGAALVIAAGVYSLWREAQLQRVRR